MNIQLGGGRCVTDNNCDAAEVFVLLLWLTYQLVLNFIPCRQLVGLGGLLWEADDLIGLFDLGQRYLGNGRQVLQAGVKKGVGRVTGERGSDLLEENGTVILWGVHVWAPSFTRDPPAWFCPGELSRSWERKRWTRCQFPRRTGKAPATHFLSSGPHHRGQRCPRPRTSPGSERSARWRKAGNREQEVKRRRARKRIKAPPPVAFYITFGHKLFQKVSWGDKNQQHHHGEV